MVFFEHKQVIGGFSDVADGDLSFYLMNEKEIAARWNQLEVVKSKKLRFPVFPEQIHSDRLREVNDSNIRYQYGAGDALLTSIKGLPVGVFTADCVPVLIWTDSCCAAVHAGWRGLHKNIVGKVINNICTRMNRMPHQLCFAIGPHINQCCFEVGEEVFESFCSVDSSYDGCFKKNERYMLNLEDVCRYQIFKSGGIKDNIFNYSNCTYCSGSYYSFRKQKKRNGSMFSFVVLNP